MSRRVLAAAFVAMAAAAIAGLGSSYAQDDGLLIEGRIVNGTPDGGAVAGLEVTLHRHTGDRIDDLTFTAGPEGWFRFESIAHDPETAYGVSVDFDGALYGVDLDLSAGAPGPIELTVYDGTDDETVLSASTVSMLIAHVDRDSQTLWALEMATIANSSDHAYVPGPEPMKLLRFGLPAGAQGLQVDSELLGADVIQVDRGFALSTSVPPGEHEVMFSYQFTYTGDQMTVQKSFPYGAEQFRLLVPRNSFNVEAGDLGAPEVVGVGDGLYELMTSEEVARGGRMSLELYDLPRAGTWDRLRGAASDVRLEFAAPAVLGLLMIALVAFAVYRRRRTRRAGLTLPTGGPARIGREEEATALARLISELDDSHRAGSVSDDDYARRYAALSSRLSALGGAETGR